MVGGHGNGNFPQSGAEVVRKNLKKNVEKESADKYERMRSECGKDYQRLIWLSKNLGFIHSYKSRN